MKKFYILLVFTLLLPTSAFAECLECKGPYGITYDVWGDRCPVNTTHTATLAPQYCGIETRNNDPFTECSASSPNHRTWVGGNNNDLIVISQPDGDLQSGTFFRLQDGRGLACSADVQQRSRFTSVRYGVHRDILDIYVPTPDGAIVRSTFRLQDGRHHGIIVGDNYIARLYGNHKDLLAAYYIQESGTVVEKHWRQPDGRDHQITPLAGSTTDFGFIYGNNDDVRARVCFRNGQWLMRDNQRDGTFPTDC